MDFNTKTVIFFLSAHGYNFWRVRAVCAAWKLLYNYACILMHILYRNGFTFYTATYNYVCERRCEAALSKVMAAWFNGYERLPVVYSGDDSVYIVLSHNKYGLFHVKVTQK